MKIKVICDGPAHRDEPERIKALGVWVDMHTFRRDLHVPGFIYEVATACPLECHEMYLRVEVQ